MGSDWGGQWQVCLDHREALLWPVILERAGRFADFDGPCFIRRSLKVSSDDFDDWEALLLDREPDMRVSVDHGPVNAMCFLLQNCPKRFSY